MAQLNIYNPHFITYKTPLLTLDVLGGVDLSSMERMIATLRIAHQNYPPHRTTLDLYNDAQTDKLLRNLCDRWELKLVEVSTCIHELILALETYRLEQLRFKDKLPTPAFEPSEQERTTALKTLKSKSLIKQLIAKLKTTGIL